MVLHLFIIINFRYNTANGGNNYDCRNDCNCNTDDRTYK